MGPTIYKPSIYNGAGIYKTGAEGGGGGGKTGTIYEFNFEGNPGAINNGYIVPNIGEKLFVNSSTSFNSSLVYNDGLHLSSSNFNNECSAFNLFGFNGKKLKFSQKVKGLSNGNWSQLGFILLGLANGNSFSRGLGICITNDLFDVGNVLNGHIDAWQFSDTINGGYHFIVPPTSLYPITDKILESSCEFDFDENTISFFENSVKCFEAINVSDDVFYRCLGYFHAFFFFYSGIALSLMRLKIECE